MKEYFELQYKRASRTLKAIGLQPAVACIVLAAGFAGLSVYLFEKTEFAVYIYISGALALAGKFSETRRNDFLKLCFNHNKLRIVRITENLIVIFPFLVFLAFQQRFVPGAVLIVLTVLLALSSFRTNLNVTIPTPFSKKPFEFTVGFRNTYYLIAAAYLLNIVAVSIDNFNLGVFSLLLVFAITLSYYTKPEPAYYVWTYSLGPGKFLLKKIKTALGLSFGLALPVIVLLGVFYPASAGILLVACVTGWAFLAYIISAKYASYPDELNLPQSIFLALCIWFPPLLLALVPYFFRKSESRLGRLLS